DCAQCKTVACGNGRRDPGEDCDPTDPEFAEGCQADCTLALGCGDGVLNAHLETDAGLPPGVDAGTLILEECDDGNRADQDGCSSACEWEFCGDGQWQPNLAIKFWDEALGRPARAADINHREECDGAPVDGAECKPDCTLEFNCEQCREQRCSQLLALDDSYFDDPVAHDCGGDCQSAVNSMLQCYEATACYKQIASEPDNSTPCVCGSLDGSACAGWGVGPVQSGTCWSESIPALAGKRALLEMLTLWNDWDYAGGRVNLYYECSANECPTECAWP